MADIVSKFIGYVAMMEPEFTHRIRGASPSEIDSLEKLIGSTLPAVYRSYLMYLGQSDGGLDLGQGATTKIDRVRSYYEELIADGNPAPPNCIVIAVEGASIGDTSLEMSPLEEPRVVNTVDDKIKGLFADSLPCLLFRLGFIKYYARTFAHSAIYTSKRTAYILPQAQDVALAIGFSREWFSDSVCFCGQGAQAAIVINQFEGRGLWLRISATERPIVEKLAEVFAADFETSFDRWWF